MGLRRMAMGLRVDFARTPIFAGRKVPLVIKDTEIGPTCVY
jgi:hypothetical protein